MLSLSSSTRYFLFSQPVDMRCGVYSLAGLVQNGLKLNPLSGDVFVFIGKRANQVRLLQRPSRGGMAMVMHSIQKGWRPVLLSGRRIKNYLFPRGN